VVGLPLPQRNQSLPLPPACCKAMRHIPDTRKGGKRMEVCWGTGGRGLAAHGSTVAAGAQGA
jgi:hypothetical protein